MVTVEPGFVGADGLFAIQDASGAIFVRVSATAGGLVVGRSVELEGTLAAPYGQLEIRDLVSLVVGDEGAEPLAASADFSDIGEQTEGSLVSIHGTVDSVTTDSGRLTITLEDGTATVRALADPPTGLSKSDVAKGDVVLVTGIVGQRATATGRLDGYRVWLRRRADLVVMVPTETGAPSPSPSHTPEDGATPSRPAVYRDLAPALGIRGAAVDVEAVVTATAGLLDIGNPTIVVDDGTAAAAVVLPDATEVPPVGMRVHVTGRVGRWETGPIVTASNVSAEGELEAVGPSAVSGPLDASLEWRLVRVCGRIDRFTPAGARWRVDMVVDGHPVVVLGEPAAAIALTKTSLGRLAVVTGIVRRSTSDSTVFQLLPRTSLDFLLGPAPGASGAASAHGSAGSSGLAPGTGAPSEAFDSSYVGIDSLRAHVGQTVTMAGLITETARDVVTIDDGTGQVRIGSLSADVLDVLEPGDAIEVTGRVRQDAQGLIIDADPASIVDLPGEAASTSKGGLIGIGADTVTPTPAAWQASAAPTRQASSTGFPSGGLALAAVLITIFVLASGSLVLARRRGTRAWVRVASSLFRPARAVRSLPRRLRLGPGKRR